MVDSSESWLILFFHCVGSISIVLNFATIFLILFKSDKIDTFRFYLLIFQILCTHTDLQLTLLIIPMPISPLIAGQCNGILATYFGIWSHYLIAFIITSIIAQMECLVFCFAKKHQIIANLVARHVLSNRWFVGGIVVTISVPISIGLVFSQSGMRREDQMDFVRQHHPTFAAKLQLLENFSIYSSSNPLLITTLAATSIGGVLCGIMFFGITIDMLKMLKELQSKVSAASFRRYKNAVHSLLAQFATSSLLLAPLFLFVVLTASQLENSNDVADVIVAMMALHGPANAFVLVVTTPPYRNYILRKTPSQSLARVNTFSGHSHGSFSRLKHFFHFR